MNAKPSTNALHFEAKKHAYRQTQDGVVISFVVHPNDVSPALASAALGSVYMVALVPMVEGQPVEAEDHSKWNALKPSQQAGIRCEDPAFQHWVDPDDVGPIGTTEYVRDFCGVKSRTELDADGEPQRKWRELDKRYRDSLGLRVSA